MYGDTYQRQWGSASGGSDYGLSPPCEHHQQRGDYDSGGDYGQHGGNWHQQQDWQSGDYDSGGDSGQHDGTVGARIKVIPSFGKGTLPTLVSSRTKYMTLGPKLSSCSKMTVTRHRSKLPATLCRSSLRSLAWKEYPSTLRFIATQGASDLITTTWSSRSYRTQKKNKTNKKHGSI